MTRQNERTVSVRSSRPIRRRSAKSSIPTPAMFASEIANGIPHVPTR